MRRWFPDGLRFGEAQLGYSQTPVCCWSWFSCLAALFLHGPDKRGRSASWATGENWLSWNQLLNWSASVIQENHSRCVHELQTAGEGSDLWVQHASPGGWGNSACVWSCKISPSAYSRWVLHIRAIALVQHIESEVLGRHFHAVLGLRSGSLIQRWGLSCLLCPRWPRGCQETTRCSGSQNFWCGEKGHD